MDTLLQKFGEKCSEPVLALHGWQDNAGTFDRLIPLLSSNLCIVAVDAVGHGLSSHIPSGTFYYITEMVLHIRRIVSYFKWNKFNLMGHSMGGAMALMYSGIFPESVKSIILLDIVKPPSSSSKNMPTLFRMYFDGLLKVEKKLLDPAPVYTIEEAQSRLISGMNNQITIDSANTLLKRGCKPSPDGKGFIFSRDIRLHYTDYLFKFSHEDLKSLMRNIKSNMLIVEGKQSLTHKSDSLINVDFKNIYKENCRSLCIFQVDGNHFLHLNNPEHVAPLIDQFFDKIISKSKL